MHDLGPEDVRRLAAALSISLDGEDATEIAHRLNAFLDALGALEGLPLDTVEPWPTSPEGAA
jgi:Asp-tRNA(Asn)/Glu-tRNA(Gln) amidotransferase C subunit